MGSFLAVNAVRAVGRVFRRLAGRVVSILTAVPWDSEQLKESPCETEKMNNQGGLVQRL
jgi:hypothetical protein